MSKYYTLEIVEMREFEGGPDPMAYYTKGHHDLAAFEDALRTFFEREVGRPLDLDAHSARHLLMRFVPVGRDDHRQYAWCPTRPGPGAFPVTYLDVAWGTPRIPAKEFSIVEDRQP